MEQEDEQVGCKSSSWDFTLTPPEQLLWWSLCQIIPGAYFFAPKKEREEEVEENEAKEKKEEEKSRRGRTEEVENEEPMFLCAGIWRISRTPVFSSLFFHLMSHSLISPVYSGVLIITISHINLNISLSFFFKCQYISSPQRLSLFLEFQTLNNFQNLCFELNRSLSLFSRKGQTRKSDTQVSS